MLDETVVRNTLPGLHAVTLLIGFLRTPRHQHINLFAGFLAISILGLTLHFIRLPEVPSSGGGPLFFFSLCIFSVGLLPAVTLWSAFWSGKFIKSSLSRLNAFPTN